MKLKLALLSFGSVVGAAFAQTPSVHENAPATAAAPAGDSDAEIVKKLSNPVSKLISLPFQNNFDFGAGPSGDGFQYKLNVQPVYPADLTEDLHLITRVILPFIHQEDVIANGSSQSGLSDTNVTLYFAPATEPGALTWGVGPVFLLPTATDDLLGTEKWSAGPALVVLKQTDAGITAGALLTQAWSFAGADDRADVNQSILQPFFSYATPGHTTYTINSESVYDWTAEHWTVPFNLEVSQLVRVGKMPVSFQLGYRYYAEKPDNGPDWGLRFSVTLVLPAPGGGR
jgi:hypothetical protein